MIESNIDAVIERTRRLPMRIDKAMRDASAPLSWLDEAREVALRTLQALARPDQVEAVVLFARTVTANVIGGQVGFALGMRKPDNALTTALRDARAAYLGAGNALERAQGLFAESIRNFEDLILLWVQTPEEEGGKRRDSRDWGKSDEDIAHLISYIMLSPNLGEGGMQSRNRLSPHIQAFMEKQMAAQGGVDPVTADLWLRAVLHAWQSWVRVRWIERVREGLRK